MRQDQIQQCLRGRATAIHSLVAVHRRRLLPALYSGLNLDPALPESQLDDASKLGASIFNAALNQLRQAPAGHLFFPWLRGLAISTVLTAQQPNPSAEHAFAAPEGLGTHKPLDKSVATARVHQAIAALPLRHRLLVWLVTAERLGVSQAAKELQLAAPVAMAMLETALAHLRGAGAAAVQPDSQPPAEQVAPLANEAAVATHRAIIHALYGEMTHAERSALEISLMRDSRSQALFEASSDERDVLAHSFSADGISTTAMLRHLRSWRNFGNRGIKPWVWVGVELTLAAVIVIGLFFLNAGVPAPTVQIEPVVGRVDYTSARQDQDRMRAFETAMAHASTIAANPDDDDDAGDGAPAPFALKVNDSLLTAPDASVRCQINGNNPVELGPDSILTLLPPVREFPVRIAVQPPTAADRLPGENLMGGRGMAWVNFMGLDVPFEVEAASIAISGRSAEFLLQHVEIADGPNGALVPRLLLIVLRGAVTYMAKGSESANVNARLYDKNTALSLTAGSGAYVSPDGARKPAVQFRPAGFARADGVEAVSLAFVRRYFRGSNGTFKTRFHWLDSKRYVLGLDAAPPVVFDRLQQYRTSLARKDEPTKALASREAGLRRELDAAYIRRLQGEREVRGAIDALTVFQEILAELRDTEADLQAQRTIIAAYRKNTSEGRRYDPTGSYRFLTQARWTVIAAQLDQVRSLRTERDALALWLRPQLPKLERAQQAVADKEAELEAIGSSIASIDRDLEASADLEQRIRDLQADIDARRKALETTETEKGNAEAMVTAAQAALDDMVTRLTAAREAVMVIEAAHEELERRQVALKDAQQGAERLAGEHEDLTAQAERVKAQLQESTPEDEKIRLEAELAQIRDALTRLEAAIDEHGAKLAPLEAAVEEAQAAYDDLEPDNAPDLEALGREQATLQQALDDAKASVAAAERAITSLQRQVRQRETRMDGLTDALAERNQLIADRGEELRAQAECAKALESAHGRYDELFAQIDPTRQRVSDLDLKLEAVPDLEREKTRLTGNLDRLDRHRRRLDDVHAERRRLEERVAELKYLTRPEARQEITESLMLANLEVQQQLDRAGRCLQGLFVLGIGREATRARIAPATNQLRSAMLSVLIAYARDYGDLDKLTPADKHWILSRALTADPEFAALAGQSWDEGRALDVTKAYTTAVADFFVARNEAGAYARLTADSLAVRSDRNRISDE